MVTNDDQQAYWENNIEHWGKLYLGISHGRESLRGPAWLTAVYRWTAVPVEAALMRRRYDLTMAFLNAYVRPGITFADIGCGVGVFSVAALHLGARVAAIDFSNAALEATRVQVARHATEFQDRITYHQIDVRHSPIPNSDVAMAMGVAPYIADIGPFLRHVLPTTRLFYCLYADSTRWTNRLRQALPYLNVRRLHFHAPDHVNEVVRQSGGRLISRSRFATGFLDLVARAEAGDGELPNASPYPFQRESS